MFPAFTGRQLSNNDDAALVNGINYVFFSSTTAGGCQLYLGEWTEYTDEEVANLVEALQFAADHPKFDFAALIPDLGQANDEIHRFLCGILASIRAAMARRCGDFARP
ncbi:hypothetical protein CIC12_21875 [Burkholderia sp. SG-MS1]|uniref:hypothetical protein n=1 Tax=Paraburkholderia sp. SG-MS1 TaxID=2023741 RepID=UPI001448989B|nr:hypothetical protein [Paraburkholderia sp. SG-MS1]NKJ49330.1 hypothetical protein [Paraburkholderia sp. SG-MS1]